MRKVDRAFFEGCFMNAFSILSRLRLKAMLQQTKWLVFALVGLSVFGDLPQSIAATPESRMEAKNLAYGEARNQSETNPALAAFNSWVSRFVAAADPNLKAQMIPEGLTLASQRRAVMAKLIQSDPEQAFASAIPASINQQLPVEIVAELETRVSGFGDFSVY